ncbi:hypothetical protein ATO8_11869 [Roseivivax marinus]|uniref:Uncharacterized protein n=1 Tax=Roseivivax marinus TaxID=1379903 RepID=W4HJ23_9RHOB|nr:hypothetical protein ATO8_11869 [Roseivivax marinus]
MTWRLRCAVASNQYGAAASGRGYQDFGLFLAGDLLIPIRQNMRHVLGLDRAEWAVVEVPVRFCRMHLVYQ